MQIGIVTVHDSSNLGSFLQALSMQELVKQHGDTPYFVKTRSSFTTLCLYLGYNNSKPVRSLRSFARFVIKAVLNFKTTSEKYCKYKVYKNDWKAYDTIINVKKANAEDCDAILFGSDEIWNVNQPAFQNPLLYGIGLRSKKKIAYAISIGNANEEQFKSFEKLKDGISNLDSIIYRDEHTHGVLSKLGFTTVGRICDPTLQVDIRKYMKPSNEVALPNKDYIVVYSYSVDEALMKFIKMFASENNLLTVAVSLPQTWCDEYLNCSPLEFGAVLSKAKYVFTSTFHGTIFSALYHTKFIVNAKLPKVKDVLELLGVSDHALPEQADYKTFSDMLKKEYDFSNMEELLKKQREDSFQIYEKYVHQQGGKNADM